MKVYLYTLKKDKAIDPATGLIRLIKCLFTQLPLKSLFSSPGRSPGRAIVLPPASALALANILTLKFFM